MADYIKRESVINAIESLPTWWADEGGYYGGMQQPRVALLEPEDVINAINKIPSADVAEVRHGKWIVSGDDNNVFGCSECYQFIFLAKGSAKPNFCPNCGARMDGGT